MINPNNLPFSVKRKEIELGIILSCLVSLITKVTIEFITCTFAFDNDWGNKLFEVFFYTSLVEGIVIGILFITNLVEVAPLSQICNVKKRNLKGCIISYWPISAIMYLMIMGWSQSWNDRFGIIVVFNVALLLLGTGVAYLHVKMMIYLKKYQRANLNNKC